MFFYYKVKLHIEDYVKLPKNPSSQAPQGSIFKLDCSFSVNLRKTRTASVVLIQFRLDGLKVPVNFRAIEHVGRTSNRYFSQHFL